MATGNAVENLREEVTCAACLDSFRHPAMLLGCGHNFCCRCLNHRSPPCPFPFSRSGFWPNWQLANVVVATQELGTPVVKELCWWHHRPLSHFCRRDGILLCTTCAERRAHPALPLEKAAGECR
ncbi:PREDICTED: tripartite motif-containing protein 10-like, partial [Buceros rhinoceros silvestris]|uniref:tripartite motif-containing protein 10-like n=1 Tax=Buceros rhinoceros silvestris TaxID=175836 RepID=UPI0005285D51